MTTTISFSKKILESDAFADLSLEAQALYIHLCLNADEKGIVFAPRRVQRSVGASLSALDELKEAGYLVFDDSGSCLIAHREDHDEDAAVDIRAYNREAQRRSREKRKQAQHVNDVSMTCQETSMTPPSPSSLPPISPSLPSPTPLSITPPIIPLITPVPPPSFIRSFILSPARIAQKNRFALLK